MKKITLEFKPASADQILSNNGFKSLGLNTQQEKKLRALPYFKKNKILVRPQYHENSATGQCLMFVEWKLKPTQSLLEGRKIVCLDITKILKNGNN